MNKSLIENNISEKLISLKLSNMANAFKLQSTNPNSITLDFNTRFDALLNAEIDERSSKKIKYLIQKSNMRLNASMERIDYTIDRGLNQGQMNSLSSCSWIDNGHNIILTGATGTGKSYIACALGNKACENKYLVTYYRLPRLLNDLKISKDNGTYNKFLKQLKRSNVLILDDFALARLSIAESRDLLEVIDDRNKNSSCIFASQIPSEKWYETFEDPTFADAIMDRIIHNAYKIALKGPSMRKITSSIEQNK